MTGCIRHALGGKKEVGQYRTGNSHFDFFSLYRHRVLRSLPKASGPSRQVQYQGDGKKLVRTLCVTVETPVKASFHTALRETSRDMVTDCVS
jgi:hypothetical protein